MNGNKHQKETVKEKIKKAFSLSEDSASNDEIRTRLLDGGQVTGTNICVLVCAMVIASVGLNKIVCCFNYLISHFIFF